MSRPLNVFLVSTLALALVGCSKTKLPTTQLDPATLVATISHGETVELEDHLVPGIWTLLEFTADW